MEVAVPLLPEEGASSRGFRRVGCCRYVWVDMVQEVKKVASRHEALGEEGLVVVHPCTQVLEN